MAKETAKQPGRCCRKKTSRKERVERNEWRGVAREGNVAAVTTVEEEEEEEEERRLLGWRRLNKDREIVS